MGKESNIDEETLRKMVTDSKANLENKIALKTSYIESIAKDHKKGDGGRIQNIS